MLANSSTACALARPSRPARSSRCASSMTMTWRSPVGRSCLARSRRCSTILMISVPMRNALSSSLATSSIASTTFRRSSLLMSAGWPPSKKRPADPMRSERSRTSTNPRTSACSSRPYPTSSMTARAARCNWARVGTTGGVSDPGSRPPSDHVPAAGFVDSLQSLRHDLRKGLVGVKGCQEERPHHVDVSLNGVPRFRRQRVDRQWDGARIGWVDDGHQALRLLPALQPLRLLPPLQPFCLLPPLQAFRLLPPLQALRLLSPLQPLQPLP